jgi:hypothetical protein
VELGAGVSMPCPFFSYVSLCSLSLVPSCILLRNVATSGPVSLSGVIFYLLTRGLYRGRVDEVAARLSERTPAFTA